MFSKNTHFGLVEPMKLEFVSIVFLDLHLRFAKTFNPGEGWVKKFESENFQLPSPTNLSIYEHSLNLENKILISPVGHALSPRSVSLGYSLILRKQKLWHTPGQIGHAATG